MRSWQKNGIPGESSMTSRHKTATGNAINKHTERLNAISNVRFTQRYHRPPGLGLNALSSREREGGGCKSGIGRTRGLQPDPTRHLVGNGLQISLIDEVRMIHDSHPPCINGRQDALQTNSYYSKIYHQFRNLTDTPLLYHIYICANHVGSIYAAQKININASIIFQSFDIWRYHARRQQ